MITKITWTGSKAKSYFPRTVNMYQPDFDTLREDNKIEMKALWNLTTINSKAIMDCMNSLDNVRNILESLYDGKYMMATKSEDEISIWVPFAYIHYTLEAGDTKLKELLAVEFSKRLLKCIGRKKMEKVVTLNKGERHICHTHDFCDPNQIMIDSVEALRIKDRDKSEFQALKLANKNNFYLDTLK